MRRFFAAAAFLLLAGTFVPPDGTSAAGVAPSASRQLRQMSGTYDFTWTSARNDTEAQDEWALSADAWRARADIVIDAQRPTAGRQSFSVELASVIEFEDLDGDARFGLGDPVVRRSALGEATSHRLRGPFLHDGLATAEMQFGFVTTQADAVRWTFLATENGTTTGGGTPLAIPMSIVLRGFPHDAEGSTYLALELRTSGNWSAAPDALRTGGPVEAEMSWKTLAGNVTLQSYGSDGRTWVVFPARPSALEVEFPFLVSFHLGMAQEDPIVARGGDLRWYLAGAVLAVAVVVGPAVRRWRSR